MSVNEIEVPGLFHYYTGVFGHEIDSVNKQVPDEDFLDWRTEHKTKIYTFDQWWYWMYSHIITNRQRGAFISNGR